MEIFESTIFDAIKQKKYNSVLSWTKNDFYENGADMYGKDEIERVIQELEDMLYSSNIGAESKFKKFMSKYKYYEDQSNGYKAI